MKLVKSLIAVLAVAVIATAASAQDKPEHKGPAGAHRGGMMDSLLPPMLVEKLNLTADQKPKYEEIAAAFKKEAVAFREGHADLFAKMKAAREAGDKDKMKELMGEMKPMQDARKASIEKLEALLTDDQKAILKEAREKMMQQHPGAHGAAKKPNE